MAQSPSVDAAPPIELNEGITLSTSQRANETVTYLFSARTSQEYLVEVLQQGLDLILTIEAPDGTTRSYDSPLLRDERELALLEPTVEGFYSIRLRSDEHSGTVGGHSIRVSTPPASTVEAWRLMSDAAERNAEQTADGWARAIEAYEQAAHVWESLDAQREHAFATYAAGMLEYWRTYDRERSSALAEQAAALYDAAGEVALRANAVHLQATSLMELAGGAEEPQVVFDRALALLQQAADVQQQLGHLGDLARTLNNLGLTHHYMSDWNRARDYWGQAATLYRNLDEWSGEAQVLINLAVVDAEEGYLPAAAGALQSALDRFAPGAHRLKMEALANLGGVQRAQGYFDEALQAFSAALTMAEHLDFDYGSAWALWGLGATYYSMGELDLAAEYLQLSLPKDRELGNREGEAATLRYLGNIEQARGDYVAALAYHEQALGLSDRQPQQALIQVLMAEDLSELGRHEDAERAARAALHIATDLRSDILSADALQQLGRIYLARGDASGAVPIFQRALASYASLGLHGEQARALNGLALAARDLGDLRSAVRHGETSLAHIESLRGQVADPELRASYLSMRRDYYELQIALLMALHEMSSGSMDQHLVAAFAVSERARARMVIDLLQEAAVEVWEPQSELRERSKTLYAELARLRHQRDRLIEESTEGANVREQLDSVLQQLATVENSLNVLELEARMADPRLRGFSPSSTLTASSIQQELDAETVLIHYALGSERSYAWILTSERITAVTLPDRQTVEEAAVQLFDLLRRRQLLDRHTMNLEARLARVAELVLEPVAEYLTKPRVLIAADGALQYVPFAVLPLRHGDDATQPLLATHEVVGVPSASALVSLRSSRPHTARERQIAVFADPVFEPSDARLTQGRPEMMSAAATEAPLLTRAAVRGSSSLTRLPMTALEASTIMEFVPAVDRFVAVGFEANLDTVTSTDLSDFSIIHFATHGLIDARYPKLSALVLSRYDESGAPRDGFLELHDIYELRLNADLVVLSACETALGRDIRGEGLIGLTQGFLYAGASSVMATLWPVPDRATAQLMRRFYHHLLVDGRSAPDALRRAQLEISTERGWSDPYYWGAFVLIGDWR